MKISIFISRLCLAFPPFLRSSCSFSSDLGNDDPELVLIILQYNESWRLR